MLYTYEEVLAELGEGEIAHVSLDFWSKVHDRLDPTKSSTTETYKDLLVFQNGWLACKAFYGMHDE